MLRVSTRANSSLVVERNRVKLAKSSHNFVPNMINDDCDDRMGHYRNFGGRYFDFFLTRFLEIFLKIRKVDFEYVIGRNYVRLASTALLPKYNNYKHKIESSPVFANVLNLLGNF